MNARHTKILNLISDRKKITVAELSEILHVSEVTMRKDLSLLEKNNLLRRSHGFAMMTETDDVGSRIVFNYEIKKRIAQKVLETIEDGETVMIESGSCCALLAEEIVTNRRDVTIITNSVFIASFIRKIVGTHLILLGGDFQNEAQVMVGPLVKKCVQNFFVDKFFCGTDGFNDSGAMSGDLMRAEAVRNMAEVAKRTIILTESKKFSQLGVVNLLPYEQISAIYTDKEIKTAAAQNLKDKLVVSSQ